MNKIKYLIRQKPTSQVTLWKPNESDRPTKMTPVTLPCRNITHGIPSAFLDGVHIFTGYGKSPSGQSRAYQVTQLCTEGVHCRMFASTVVSVVLNVVPVTGATFADYHGTIFVRLSFPTPTCVLIFHYRRQFYNVTILPVDPGKYPFSLFSRPREGLATLPG